MLHNNWDPATRDTLRYTTELVRHVSEECGELLLATNRLAADKADAHPAAVLREIISLVGFLEAIALRPEWFVAEGSAPDAYRALLGEALSDYQAKLDQLGITNPMTCAFVKAIVDMKEDNSNA